MSKCPACNHQNPSDSVFCLKCGSPLGLICPACGHNVLSGSKFCNQCGYQLSKSQPHHIDSLHQKEIQQSLRSLMPAALAKKNAIEVKIAGERREVTVLVVKLVDITRASQPIDSEDIYLFTNQAMRLVSKVVYEYEGIVDKFTGETLIALFGATIAHENDPERAINAALDIDKKLNHLYQHVNKEQNLNFEVRIGINTGAVIIGKNRGGSQSQYTIVGNTVDLALRLVKTAGLESISASFATYQRTRPLFEFKVLPITTKDQKPDMKNAYKPLGLLSQPGQIRGLPGLQAPMIGRQEVLKQLKEALTNLLEQQCARFAVVTGEAGVGKSRLIAEFLADSSGLDCRFYQSSCLTYTRSKPLWLVANLLRATIDLPDSDSLDVQYQKLKTYLLNLNLNPNDILPYLMNVLGLEPVNDKSNMPLLRFDTQALQKQTYAALRQVLLAEASTGPTVLILEDLHWIDPASRDFIEHLIQTFEQVPLMLVLVSRHTERNTVVKPLITAVQQYHNHLLDIQLKPLSKTEQVLLIDNLLKQNTPDIQSLKHYIADRAEGNPFYTEEIIRMLMDQGGLTKQHGIWQITAEDTQLLQKIPGTLQGLILARLDRLPEELRRVLQKAAVLGTWIPVELLQKLNGTTPELFAQLKELEARQFLVAESSSTEDSYKFSHALMQDIIYKTLLKRDRQSIHEQVALALEEMFAGSLDAQAEGIAQHYVNSASPFRAIPYLITAAENAARRCANEIAVQHYQQALKLMQSQTAEPSDQFLQAQIGLGQALKFIGEFSEASQVLSDSLQYLLQRSLKVESTALLPFLIYGLKELADIRVREGASEEAVIHLEAGLDALGEKGTQKTPKLWHILVERLAWVRFRQGKLEEAFTLASSATLGKDVKHKDDPMTLASLYNTLGGIFWQWGNLSEAATYVERSLELHKTLGYAWGMAIAYTNLGVLNYYQGTWSQAAEYFEQAYTLRRENGYIPEQALNLYNLGVLHTAMGEHSQAQQQLETSLAISRKLGDDFSIGLGELGLTHLSIIQGRIQEANTHLKVVLNLLNVVGEDNAIQARWLQALIQAEQGDFETGTATAEQALYAARAATLSEAEIDCSRVLGVLRARSGDYLEAERLLRASIDVSVQTNSPYGQAKALLELGLIYQKQASGNQPNHLDWQIKAETTLKEAAKQLKRLGAMYDLNIAQSALKQIQSELADIKPAQLDIEDPLLAKSPLFDAQLPGGERHTAAIVYLTLSPSPEADEESVFEAMALITTALTTIAHEYEGQIIKRQDGLTIIFGAPAAYEDDTERAVQAAAYIQQQLKELTRQTEISLIFNLAVSQGNIIAGHIGPQFGDELMIAGEPVQIAEKIAETALPGRVWVTDTVCHATKRVCRYFSDTVQLDNLIVWELEGFKEEPAPARGLPGFKAKFVGRESLLKQMTTLAKGVNRGIGGLIWIEGEPGIGKSRLMKEFTTEMTIASTEMLIWAGKCSPQKSRQALSLFTDLLGQVFNLQPADNTEQIQTKIRQTLQVWPRDVQMARPYLEILVGVPPSGIDGARLNNLEPEQLRQQIFVTLRRVFISLAHTQPLIILLDDLHWIDSLSAELLQFLVTMVASVPILFVCAQRRQGADAPNDRLLRVQNLLTSQTLRFHLARLTEAESQILLDDLLPHTQQSEAFATIIKRGEGNPYFIEEYVRMLIDQGYINHDHGEWEVAQDVHLEKLPLPSSLDALIRSRVDTLPTNLKQLMQWLAVIGVPFEAGMIKAITGMNNIKVSLNRLETRLLIRRTSEAGQWDFNHSMIEFVVYNSLLKTQRKTYHLKIGNSLEDFWVGAEAEHAEKLAYHFTHANEDKKALKYLVLAGERAALRSANEEAMNYFEQAAELLGKNHNVTDELRWRLVAGLGDVYRTMGRYEDSTATLETGLVLAETENLPKNQHAGLYRRLGETARKHGKLEVAYKCFSHALNLLEGINDTQTRLELARVLIGVAWVHFFQGKLEEAQRACEASLTHARSSDALTELAAAENLLGGIYYRQSNWTSAMHHTMRAMILREQMGYSWGAAGTLSNLGILAVLSGQWNKARSFFERSLKFRNDLGDVEGVAIIHNNLGNLTRDQGDLEQAAYHFKETLTIATRWGMEYHAANAELGLGMVYLLEKEIDKAQQSITTSLTQLRAIGAKELVAENYRGQAEIFMAQQDWQQALAAAEQSAEMAIAENNRTLEAAAWRVAAEIALEQGQPDNAQTFIDKAQESLSKVTAELEVGRVAALAGRIELRKENREEAELNLRRAKEIFMRLGASLDLDYVENILNKPAEHNNRLAVS